MGDAVALPAGLAARRPRGWLYPLERLRAETGPRLDSEHRLTLNVWRQKVKNWATHQGRAKAKNHFMGQERLNAGQAVVLLPTSATAEREIISRARSA